MGKPGQCKTLSMTAACLDDASRGLDVMPNYSLRIPKYRGWGKVLPFDLSQFTDPDTEVRNLTVAVDEGWQGADSRRSGSQDNIEMSRKVLQSRKFDANYYFTAQGFSQLDVRIRNNCTLIALCQKRYANGVRCLDPFESPKGGEAWVYFYPVDADQPINRNRPLRLKMEAIYPFFDTKQVIMA